jgi:hypothetical protein
VALVHVDQTTTSAIARVHRHLPEADAPSLVKRRFQIINLWRPISHAALDWPLALCDYRSLDGKKDLHPVALIYPDREGETFGVSMISFYDLGQVSKDIRFPIIRNISGNIYGAWSLMKSF